jgi:hypothetical protein
MTNTNFKSGDSVNWLIMGQVAMSGLVIDRITIDQKYAWVKLPEDESGEQMIVKVENLEAA